MALLDAEEPRSARPGQREGRDGLKDPVSTIVEGLAPTFTIEDAVAEGDRVVARWTISARHVGDFIGIPPTGRSCAIAGHRHLPDRG